ncbi:MAG: winged helix-turn-helix transcriptional regulator [Campylobacteraceae bacterium]|nr:winged helix-turn-helix transcriptional regulator [Campylobacteraceae bacterium]
METFLETVGAANSETRVEVLAFLMKHGECCVCELEKSLGMTQARLSTNLAILRKAGFVSVAREGKWAYYDIDPKTTFHKELLEEIKKVPLTLPELIRACNIPSRG